MCRCANCKLTLTSNPVIRCKNDETELPYTKSIIKTTLNCVPGKLATRYLMHGVKHSLVIPEIIFACYMLPFFKISI